MRPRVSIKAETVSELSYDWSHPTAPPKALRPVQFRGNGMRADRATGAAPDITWREPYGWLPMRKLAIDVAAPIL